MAGPSFATTRDASGFARFDRGRQFVIGPRKGTHWRPFRMPRQHRWIRSGSSCGLQDKLAHGDIRITLLLLLPMLLVVAMMIHWPRRSVSIAVRLTGLATAGLCCLLIVILLVVQRPLKDFDAWYGVEDSQAARVVLSLNGDRLSVLIAGPLGRPCLDTVLPLPKNSERHLFIGKTNGYGESMMPKLSCIGPSADGAAPLHHRT